MDPKAPVFTKAVSEFIASDINLKKDFFKNREKIEKTKLFKFFRQLTKGVLNHVHFPAFNSLEDWLELLKRDETVKDVEKGVYSVLPKDAKLGEGMRR